MVSRAFRPVTGVAPIVDPEHRIYFPCLSSSNSARQLRTRRR